MKCYFMEYQAKSVSQCFLERWGWHRTWSTGKQKSKSLVPELTYLWKGYYSFSKVLCRKINMGSLKKVYRQKSSSSELGTTGLTEVKSISVLQAPERLQPGREIATFAEHGTSGSPSLVQTHRLGGASHKLHNPFFPGAPPHSLGKAVVMPWNTLSCLGSKASLWWRQF